MGDRDQNVGRKDRIVRLILGVIAVVTMGYLFTTQPLTPAISAALFALLSFIIITIPGALTGTCGTYALLDVSTCSQCEDDSPSQTWG